jgi:hypothetical protein
MRRILLAWGLAVGVAVLWSQNADAVPANAGVVQEAATAASAMQQVQYIEHRTRHGIVKCYRDLVIGPYRCHHYY